jgi:hypothetical protein
VVLGDHGENVTVPWRNSRPPRTCAFKPLVQAVCLSFVQLHEDLPYAAFILHASDDESIGVWILRHFGVDCILDFDEIWTS